MQTTRRSLLVQFGSHVGMTRAQNEDAVRVDGPLLIVADGMGGHQGGEVASRLAVDGLAALRVELEQVAARGDAGDLVDAFRQAMHQLSQEIEAEAARRGRQGMGTTLVCALMQDGVAHIAHVGDSRAYLLRGGTLHRLTQDHSVAELYVRQGKLTREQADASPLQHRLYAALGHGNARADVTRVEVAEGDVLMLCSDGLTGPVAEDAIAQLLASDPATAVTELIAAANAAGGPDNVSVVVCQVAGGEAPVVVERRRKALWDAGLFRRLDARHLRALAPYLEQSRFRAGDVLARDGETADACLLLVEGRVRIHAGEMELTVLGPGGHLGELALTGPWRRSASATALDSGVLLTLTRSRFQDLVNEEPEVAVRLATELLSFVGERLVDMTDRADRARRVLAGDD